MLLQPDCIGCILKMSISLIRKLHLEEKQVKALYSKILEIPALKGQHWDITAPEVIEKVMIMLTDAVGDQDPFAAEKIRLNNTLMDRYSFFQHFVNQSSNPLYTAVKLAITGNTIDFMIPEVMADIEKTVRGKLDKNLPYEFFIAFKEKLEVSKQILYFGDNTGEVVLDKLLMETIRLRYNPEIIFVVRSVPTLNDVTLKDITPIGINRVASVIENGINGPLPGTILNRCSAEIRDHIKCADLIISKGGGNYDSLGEERDYQDKITYMLMSKCYPYDRDFGVNRFQPVLAGGSSR